jgi:predicted exporter
MGWKSRDGIHIETNVLELIPSIENDPVIKQVLDSSSRRLEKRLFFLIGHEQADSARQAAGIFFNSLKKAAVFEKIDFSLNQMEKDRFFHDLFPFKYHLLPPRLRSMLQDNAGGMKLLERTKRLMFSPLGMTNSHLLKNDPLFLFPEYLQSSFADHAALGMENDVLSVQHDGITYIFITATLKGNPFYRSEQERITLCIDEALYQVQKYHTGLQILSSGLMLYARAGAESAEREISTIGTVSLVSILLLILLVFRSVRPLLVGVLPIAVGFLAALSLSLIVFGQVHILTLLFGMSLTGISIDYSFHYFSHQLTGGNDWNAAKGLAHIFPGITMGLITTIFGYTGLFLSSFPGLNEMALFSSTGIAAAYGTVVCWFPFLMGKKNSKMRLTGSNVIRRNLSFWQFLVSSNWKWPGLILLALFIITGTARVKFNDDIRLLHNAPEQLEQEDSRLRELIGISSSTSLLIIEGDSPQSVLRLEEEITPHLENLMQEKKIASYSALSSVIPSKERQLENVRLLQERLLTTNLLAKYLLSMGFSDSVSQAILSSLAEAHHSFLSFSDWLTSPSSAPLQHLWMGKTTRGYASIVILEDVQDEKSVQIMSDRFSRTAYVNQVRSLSRMFQRSRHLAILLVAFSYGGIFILLLIKYGIRRGNIIFFPPVVAAAVTLAVMGWFGLNQNFFNTLALLLVLGIGIDYTIFFQESKNGNQSTMLAIFLSACTTILSFGLLSLSSTPALKSFGLTVLVGILFSFIFSPVVTVTSKAADRLAGKQPFKRNI